MVKAALEAILEKKGEDVAVFDMRGFTPFVDYQIVASAASAIQAKVLLDGIVANVKKSGFKLRSVEGDSGSGWVLIDFWDLVIHIFRPELRQYYNLEALWADLPSVRYDENTGVKITANNSDEKVV
jgi:ribosome-associated protein